MQFLFKSPEMITCSPYKKRDQEKKTEINKNQVKHRRKTKIETKITNQNKEIKKNFVRKRR